MIHPDVIKEMSFSDLMAYKTYFIKEIENYENMFQSTIGYPGEEVISKRNNLSKIIQQISVEADRRVTELIKY